MKKLYIFLIAANSTFIASAQTKHVLVEEFTGSWCGYCPEGNLIVDSLMNKYPGLAYAIAYHSEPGLPGGEAMETPISLQFANDFMVSAFPSAMIDRNPYQGNPVIQNTNIWIPRATAALSHSTMVDVSISHNYNATNRLSSGTVDVTLYNAFTGKLFVNLMFIENNVSDSSSGYSQTNYNNNVVGSPFYGLGNPIVGYHHNRVFRTALTDVYGDSTLIPMGVTSGSYSLPFSYTVDTNFNPAEMEIVAFVSRKLTTQTNQQSVIENVNSSPVLTFTGIYEHQSQKGITSIEPNPSSTVASVSFLITNNGHAKLEIYNATGSKVLTIADQKYTNGIYREYADISTLQPGVYFIRLESENQNSTRKLIVVH